jgi:cytoskeletal protein RodZ
MMRQRLLSALVALIAVGVVAAVVYLERSNTSGAASTANTTTSTSTSTTSSTTVPTTTVAPATAPTTTELPTTTSSAPTTTLAPASTLPPPDRSLVPVVVSSGPSDGQRLGPGAELMAAVGWTDIRPLTGSIALTDTVVFFADGQQAAAELLAADTGLPVTAVAPLADAPPVAGLANAQLLYYFGGT